MNGFIRVTRLIFSDKVLEYEALVPIDRINTITQH